MRKMVPTGGADISKASVLSSCTTHARGNQKASGGRAQSRDGWTGNAECRQVERRIQNRELFLDTRVLDIAIYVFSLDIYVVLTTA